MQRLFDYDVATPSRPQPDAARARRAEEEPQLYGRAPAAVWSLLLDGGVDPLALADLLRDGLSAAERRRAYLELVRDVGAPIAGRLWQQALAGVKPSRGDLPADARRVAEAALGRTLPRIDIMRGPAVDALTARMGTPAYTLGRQLFVRSGESSTKVLVHEAIHAVQQEGASARKAAGPSEASEREAHSILRRLGPMDAAPSLLADRARASLAVRAALGRAPRVTARPLQLAAYEATHASVDSVLGEAQRMAEALVKLLERGASRTELQQLLGPEGDGHQARVRATAMHALGGRRVSDGRDARKTLADRLNGNGKVLPSSLRAELESRLGASFGDVRVHDDPEAASQARRLGARAFTQGQDVFFGDGKYDPSSPDGRRLIAHELTHVAQQAGAPATSAPTVSPSGSAVEREADRVSHAFADGARAGAPSLEIRERAPAGTISRDDGGGAGGTPQKWDLHLLQRTLPLVATQLSGARDLGDGRKQVDINQTLGPIRISSATFHSAGDSVDSGTLAASIDTGPFRGGSGSLSVDRNGAVTGNLTLPVSVPGAVLKNVTVEVGADGFHGTANLSPQDLLSRDFPVQATDFVITVASSPAGGIDASITGGATVNVQNGMAAGAARMTAELHAGPSGYSFAATVQGNIDILGLQANVQATITFDGHNITITAGADIPVNLPGIEGIAHVSYADGKLSVSGENVRFTIPQLSAVVFDDVRVEDGRLKAALHLGSPVSMPLPGGGTAALTASTLQIDGANVTGEATGTFSVGPGGAVALSGTVNVGYHGGQLDGAVTIGSASVPGLSVSGLTIGVQDLFRGNHYSVSGNVDVNLMNGLVQGHWADLAMDPGGSLTGQVGLHFGIPRLGLPDISLNVMPGWRIAASTAGGPISLDLGGALGQLSQLTASVDVTETDIRNIPRALGDIHVTGAHIAPPALASVGALDSVDLHLPGAGGSYDFSQFTGSAALHITAFPGAPISIGLQYANGQLSTQAEVDVDVHTIIPPLAGNVKVGYVSGQPNPITVHAAGITAADPKIAQYVSIPNIDYANGNLSGDIAFASGPVTVGPVSGNITNGSIHFAKPQAGPVQLTGKVDVQMGVAAAGANATGHISYDENGQLKVEGTVAVDLAGLTKGMMTGQLVASNEGGANSLSCNNANFASGPLQGVFQNGITVTKTGAQLTANATLDVAALQKFLPAGVTPSGAITLNVHKDSENDRVHFTPSGTAGVNIGGDFLTATVALEDQDAGIGATITADVAVKPPGVTLTGHAAVKIGADKSISLQPDANINVDVLNSTVTAKIQPILDGNRISGVTIDGNVKDTKFTNPTPFSFHYNNGQWGAGVKIGMKDVAGVLHGGSLDFSYAKPGGFKAHAENIPLAGALEGLSIDEAHLDSTSYGATISGGKDIKAGSVKISIDSSSKLTIDSQTGLTGTAKGSVTLGPLPKINVSVTANGDQPVDIHADTDIDISKVSSFLAGNLHVSYDRNQGANAFGFQGTNVMVNADPIKNQVLFSNVEAHWNGKELTGSLTAGHVNVKADIADVTVEGGTIDLLPGYKLNGDLKAHLTAGGADAHASVGWAMGKFKWEAGGTVQLGGLTNHMLEGEVEATAASGGNGTLKNNTPITFGASAPAAVKDIKVTAIHGGVAPGKVNVHVSMEAKDAVNKLTSGLQGVTVNVGHAPIVVDYNNGAFGMSAHLQGSAAWEDKISGDFDLGWDNGFTGKIEKIKITAGDGFHSTGGSIDLKKGDIDIGDTHFHVGGVADGKVTGGGNVRERKFALVTDVDVEAMKGLKVHVQADNTQVTGKLASPQPIKLGEKITVTVMDDSSVTFAKKGGLSAHLHAHVDAAEIGTGELTADRQGNGFTGTASFNTKPFALFKETAGNLQFHAGKLSTDDKGITLELADQYATYFDASVNLKLANNAPNVTGNLTKLKNLGKLSDAFKGAQVSYHSGQVKAEGHFDLAPVFPNVLKAGSNLNVTYDGALNIDGTIRPNDMFGGAVKFDDTSHVTVSWSSATKKVKVDGSAHADVAQLATIDLTVQAGGGGGDPGSFDLEGKIQADGLAKYIKGVTFANITGDVKVHVGDGATDFGVAVDADVTGIPAAGITECAAHIHGQYDKGKGLSGSVVVSRIKVGDVLADGRIDLKENKFDSGEIHVVANFPSVLIEGTGKVQAGDLGKLSTTADLKVTPGDGSPLAKFIESGSIHVDIHEWQLMEATGTLNLVPPTFMKLYDPKVVISYKKGAGISAVLTTQFDAPFAKNNEKGNFAAGYESGKGLFAHIDFPVTIPGFQQASVFGELNQKGVTIGADLVPRENQYIKSAHVEIGYGDGGFHFLGKVTLTPDPEHEMEIGVQYVQGSGFSMLNADLKDKHEDNGDHPVGGFKKDVDIPLATIGVASLNLKLGVGVGAGYRMPKIKLKDPKIEGGLEALDSGGLPPISFGGTVAMGAYLALWFSIQITGKIDLLVATAEAGIGAKITALLNLELGADVNGRYEQGKGALLKIDPFVHASLDLIASLIATLYASIAWFTIIDKEYTLASANLAHIDLGTFRPFAPIQVQLGGPGGTHLVSGLHLRDGMTDDMEKGVQDGSKKASDNEANKESKQKLAPVLKSMRAAAVQFEQLPEGWENGMVSAPVDFDSMFHIDGDAWDFYREHADDAETIDPEDACTSPTQKLAKAVAQASKNNPAFAGRIVLEWRRAQIAHMGVNPDTGVNVVQEREEVQALIAAKYAADLAEVQRKQKEQDDEHAAHVVKQHADWTKAEQEHHHKIAAAKAEHEQKVKHHEEEGKKAQKQVEDAEKMANKEGAAEKPKESDKAPPPPPPPLPPTPAPLAKPDPIPVPPPVPLPPPMLVLPGVTLPALPSDPGVSINIFSPPSPPTKKVQVKQPGGGDGPPTGSSPDPAPGAASGVAKGPTGGSALPAGDGGPSGSKKSGGGGAAPPGPQVAAGAAGIISQAKTLDAKKAEYGGGAGGKGGGKGPAPAAAAAAATAAAPAGGGAGGAAGGAKGAGSKDKNANAKKDAVTSGKLDPTVEKVAAKGKADEEKQHKELKQKEVEYKNKIDQKTKGAQTATTNLEHAADDAHKRHEMPAAGLFPPGTVEQARVAFSNFVKQKREGETFASFKDKYAQKKAFNFDVKVWVDVVQEMQKIHDAMKPEDVLPDPKDFAPKLYAGNSYVAKTYKPAAGYEAAYSLSDETIKALELFEKFKTNNKGSKPGQYLIAEVEKMNDVERTAFVNSKLLVLAAASEAAKVLRVALDKLGPAAQVQQKVAEIDGGKLVPAPQFWAQMLGAFNQGVAGIAQINDVVAKMQAHDPKGAAGGAGGGAAGGADAKGGAAAGGGSAPAAASASGAPAGAAPAGAAPAGAAPAGGAPASGGAAAGGKDAAGPGAAAGGGASASSASAAGGAKDAKSGKAGAADKAGADAKGGAQQAAKDSAGLPPGSDGGGKKPAPAMVGIEKIKGHLSELDAFYTGNASRLGMDVHADLMANKAALMEKRRDVLQVLMHQNPGVPPEQVYDHFKTTMRGALDALRGMADGHAANYARIIAEARKSTPRLSSEGVRAAVEQMRLAIGSATKPPLQIPELNPAGIAPEEMVPDAQVSDAVGDANWNVCFDEAWVTKTFLPDKFDRALLLGENATKADEKDKAGDGKGAGDHPAGASSAAPAAKPADGGAAKSAGGAAAPAGASASAGAAATNAPGGAASAPSGGASNAAGGAAATGGAGPAGASSAAPSSSSGGGAAATSPAGGGGSSSGAQAGGASPAGSGGASGVASSSGGGGGNAGPSAAGGAQASASSGGSSSAGAAQSPATNASAAPPASGSAGAGGAAASNGPNAAKSGTPAPAKTAPVPGEEKSHHAAGPAPGGWQSKVRVTMPAEEVAPDDRGHTYHILKSGEVVATTEPVLVEPVAAHAAVAKHPHTDAEIQAACAKFEIRIGNHFATAAEPAAKAMMAKAKRYMDERSKPYFADKQRVDDEMKKLGGAIYEQWAGRVGMKVEDIEQVLGGAGNIRELITTFNNFYEKIFVPDLFGGPNGLKITDMKELATELGLVPEKLKQRKADAEAAFEKAKEKAIESGKKPGTSREWEFRTDDKTKKPMSQQDA
ncbi:MAG TPA: DUF4157 domain-containing protein, partial [Polyangia bacterium]|nr:DUF4157 domain-containing protein [Polyangia bacterium]